MVRLSTRTSGRVASSASAAATHRLHGRAAGAQDLGCCWVIEQCEQKMLDRDEFVALLARLEVRRVEASIKLVVERTVDRGGRRLGDRKLCVGSLIGLRRRPLRDAMRNIVRYVEQR